MARSLAREDARERRIPRLQVGATCLVLCLLSAASEAALVGDKRAVPEELLSPEVLAAAEEVLLEVERSSSRKVQPALLGLTRVLAASKQVVAGVLWELELELSPTTCRRNKDVRVDSAAELRERCKQNDQRVAAVARQAPPRTRSLTSPRLRATPARRFARVFEATALHRAWIKEAPWTVTVKRFRDAGSGEWKPFVRTAEALSDAERARLIAEDAEAAKEQEESDRRREAIAARMRAEAPSEDEDVD